jgi:RNA polymerase sigma-70 factor (ECF subfamily)
LSYAEIADRLGVAKNTVTVHMVKAVSCLKARFSKVSLPGG